MIPASGFVAPPPPEWVGSTQEKGKKQYVSLCGSLTTRITCIHTYTQTIHTHTYLQTNTYIHTSIHACIYRHAPPPTGGGRGILYIHTYILTYKYIHTPIHACTYRHAPPTHRGGGGKTTCNRPAPPVHIDPCAPRPFGGGVGWGLQTWTIYACLGYRYIDKSPVDPRIEEIYAMICVCTDKTRCVHTDIRYLHTSIML